MNLRDEGIIISTKKYGENSLIIKVFSRNCGVFRGFVKFAKSNKVSANYQIGNLISFEYRSRIEENLGSFAAVNLINSFCSRIIFDRFRLNCAKALFSMIDELFLERENHQIFFEQLLSFLKKIILDNATRAEIVANYVRLELAMLSELGYGIDLSSCVVTESTENLAYVSPKSARAVSSFAGKIHENKLLKLPAFLVNDDEQVSDKCLVDGLKLSGFFIQKFLATEQKKFIEREEIANLIKLKTA
jgi:DNA repair protein RecO (recombination protein O)